MCDFYGHFTLFRENMPMPIHLFALTVTTCCVSIEISKVAFLSNFPMFGLDA
jgi:hypothetical protein